MHPSSKTPSIWTPCAVALAVSVLTACGGNSDRDFGLLSNAGSRQCSVSYLQSLAPTGTTITGAVSKTSPANCEVDGTIVVTNPGPSTIKFRMALPTSYKNRQLFFSQGGSGGGKIPWILDTSSVAAPSDHDFSRLMNNGFAIVAYDKGTTPLHELDFSWKTDPAQVLNWDNRALQSVAEISQGLTKNYYGAAQMYRYVSGCSGGGMATINNMRVHGGKNFDGIIVGSTVVLSPIAGLSWPRIMKYINDKPSRWISPATMQAGEAAIMAAYDGVDGEVDGVIKDPRNITFDYTVLRNAGFTDDQVDTFKYATASWTYYGTTTPIQVPGFSFSRPTDWIQWFIGMSPAPWGKTLRPWDGTPLGYFVSDSNFRAIYNSTTDFFTDLDLDSATVHQYMQNGTNDNGKNAPFDFRAYRNKGGKLMTYFGVDDAAIPVDMATTIRTGAASYETSASALNNWFRSYRVPGSTHCGGAMGPGDTAERMLDAMVEWVEAGKAPETIAATRKSDGRVFQLARD